MTTQGWKGIDNLHSDVEIGADVLRNASNFDFTASGKLRTRQGYSRLLTGAAHSGFGFAGHLIYVRAGWVEAFNIRSGVVTQLFPVVGARLGHVVIGDEAYVSDGASKWRVDSSLSVLDWPTVAADDPTFDARFVSAFPACVKLTSFKGRLVGAIGNVVVYSLPHVHGSMNSELGFFAVRGEIRALHANDDALFIGADDLVTVGGLGAALTPLVTALPVQSFDSAPAIDAESGDAFWMTERGVVRIPKTGNQAQLLSASMVAVRPARSAATGVFRRDGAIGIVSTMVPDTSAMEEHPMVAEDFVASELLRKEIYDAL